MHRPGEINAEFPNGLVSDDDAKKVYVQRSKSVDEKTVTAAKKEALATKVQGEEQDGWTVAKKNKTSVRMSKPKPVDRQLEDDVWCLLHRLGFTEFSADRNFTIKLGANAPGRQIDIFAKDDETVFIVECTHAQEPGAKSVKALIDKINGMREDIIKAIHCHYGKEPKLKVKFCIATRNVVWRKADKDRAAESKIAVLTEQDIAYFTKLTDFVRDAARYQFLARYLRGEGVDGLRTDVPATKGNMGGTTFYNFLISPYDLLKIAYISQRASGVNDLDTYQRMVKGRGKVAASAIMALNPGRCASFADRASLYTLTSAHWFFWQPRISEPVALVETGHAGPASRLRRGNRRRLACSLPHQAQQLFPEIVHDENDLLLQDGGDIGIVNHLGQSHFGRCRWKSPVKLLARFHGRPLLAARCISGTKQEVGAITLGRWATILLMFSLQGNEVTSKEILIAFPFPTTLFPSAPRKT